MKSIAQMAAAMYESYCIQAGGKTFDGKPLPTYEQLGSDRQACWEAAANRARKEIEIL